MAQKALHAFLWDALSFQCTLPVVKHFVDGMPYRRVTSTSALDHRWGRTAITRATCIASAGFKGDSGVRCILFTEK